MLVSARRLACRAGALVVVIACGFGTAPAATGQGLDPNVPLTSQPKPSVLPTVPDFAYFVTPRDLAGCPYATSPPPVVDESEVPKPGQQVPAAPSVPEEPAGGKGMAGCRPVAAEGFRVPPDVTASGWIVADADSRQVLAAQDPHGRHRPASIIKVLLALVVLDELDLTQTVTVKDSDIAEAEGTMLGIGAGGEYTVDQLLTGMLLLSGNDAAYTLAAQLGGPPATLRKMADKCREIGCTDTSPQSVSGLDKPGNMTSAYDMALIFSAALERDEFRRMISIPRIGFPGYPAGPFAAAPDPNDPKVAGEPGGPQFGVPDADGIVHNADGTATDAAGDPVHPGFVVYNDNQLLANYPGALGGKTGFTDDARQTFMGAAERNGRRLLVVLLDGTRMPKAPWEQAAQLLDAGFAVNSGEGVGELVGSKVDAAAAAGTQPDYAAASSSAATSEGTRAPWFALGVGALLVALAAGVSLSRRGRRPAGSEKPAKSATSAKSAQSTRPGKAATPAEPRSVRGRRTSRDTR